MIVEVQQSSVNVNALTRHQAPNTLAMRCPFQGSTHLELKEAQGDVAHACSAVDDDATVRMIADSKWQHRRSWRWRIHRCELGLA